MLIVALVLAVIGLAALVTAVVTSNEVIAWVCIGASVLGVLLLVIDAVRERNRRDAGPPAESDPESDSDSDEADLIDAPADADAFDADYPDDGPVESDADAPALDDTTDLGAGTVDPVEETTVIDVTPDETDHDEAVTELPAEDAAGEDRGSR